MALYYRYRAVVYMACGSAVVWKIWAYRGELVRYYRLPRGTTAVDFYRGGPTLETREENMNERWIESEYYN